MPVAQLFVEERLYSGTPERIQRFSYLPPEPFDILLVNESPYRPHRTDPPLDQTAFLAGARQVAVESIRPKPSGLRQAYPDQVELRMKPTGRERKRRHRFRRRDHTRADRFRNKVSIDYAGGARVRRRRRNLSAYRVDADRERPGNALELGQCR